MNRMLPHIYWCLTIRNFPVCARNDLIFHLLVFETVAWIDSTTISACVVPVLTVFIVFHLFMYSSNNNQSVKWQMYPLQSHLSSLTFSSLRLWTKLFEVSLHYADNKWITEERNNEKKIHSTKTDTKTIGWKTIGRRQQDEVSVRLCALNRARKTAKKISIFLSFHMNLWFYSLQLIIMQYKFYTYYILCGFSLLTPHKHPILLRNKTVDTLCYLGYRYRFLYSSL